MVNLIAAPSAAISSLLNSKNYSFNQAVAQLTVCGLVKGYSIKNIIFLAQQIAQETAWATSYSYHNDFNAWGMNCVSSRETTQIGCRETDSGEVLGMYDNVYRSTVDRFLWDSYWGYDSLKRSTDYAETISKKYHTSVNYASAVSNIDTRSIRIAVYTAILTTPVELFLLYKLFKYIF